MNPLKLFLESTPIILNVANARQTGAGRDLLKVVKGLRDKHRKEYETKPMRSPEDLTKDVVFLLGAVWAFNYVLELPKITSDYIEKQPEKGE